MAKLIKIGDKWYSDLRMGGKRIRRALSIYKPKAQKMLEDLVALRRVQRHGGIVDNISWYTFRLKWLDHRKNTKSPNTYMHDELAVLRLEKAFPILQRLSQITPDLLEQAKTEWTSIGIGVYAIAKHLRVLKRMMRDAKKWNLVEGHDWTAVSVKKDRKRVIYYTMDEYRKILSVCKGHWKTAAMLMGRAGLRPEEARHLEWGDINFKDRTISIRVKEHLNWKPKKYTDEDPHERLIDMPTDLEAHLKSLARGPGFVLGSDLIKEHTFKRYFERLAQKTKIKGFAYAFRHSYASHLISNGCTLEEVGALLGHRDNRSTQIYAHLLPHARRTAVDKLPAL
jgi:integrase